MSTHLAQDLAVTRRQFDAREMGDTLETRKAGCGHPVILPQTRHATACVPPALIQWIPVWRP